MALKLCVFFVTVFSECDAMRCDVLHFVREAGKHVREGPRMYCGLDLHTYGLWDM